MSKKLKIYVITKTFIGGVLKGITIEDRSPVSFEVGKTYGGGATGSRYIVNGCREA
jgi:hypothetical protein